MDKERKTQIILLSLIGIISISLLIVVLIGSNQATFFGVKINWLNIIYEATKNGIVTVYEIIKMFTKLIRGAVFSSWVSAIVTFAAITLLVLLGIYKQKYGD